MLMHHRAHDDITHEQGTGVELAIGFAAYAIGLSLIGMLALVAF